MSKTEFIQTADGVFPQQRGSDELFNKKIQKRIANTVLVNPCILPRYRLMKVIYLLLVTLSN